MLMMTLSPKPFRKDGHRSARDPKLHDERKQLELRCRESVELRKALLVIAGMGNPNPTREGCPTRDVLKALSRRELPIEDTLRPPRAVLALLSAVPCVSAGGRGEAGRNYPLSFMVGGHRSRRRRQHGVVACYRVATLAK